MLGGDDPILFQYLMAGVDGVMVIAPPLFPAAFRQVWNLIEEGETAAALGSSRTGSFRSCMFFGVGDEIATTKALLHDIGVFASDELRPPLVEVGPERRELLRSAYDLWSNAICVRPTHRRRDGHPRPGAGDGGLSEWLSGRSTSPVTWWRKQGLEVTTITKTPRATASRRRHERLL